MKIKSDFITNSSSVAFIIEKDRAKNLSEEQLAKLVEIKLNPINYGLEEWDDCYVIEIGSRDDEDIDDQIDITLDLLGPLKNCGRIDRDM